MKTPFYSLIVVSGILILGCLLFSGCAVAMDPKVYEESAELIEEIIKDEAK